jgi:hypothetical protein
VGEDLGEELLGARRAGIGVAEELVLLAVLDVSGALKPVSIWRRMAARSLSLATATQGRSFVHSSPACASWARAFRYTR